MKRLWCKLVGHRSIVIGGSPSGGCLLCERCGYLRRLNWTSGYSILTLKKAKWG